MKQRAMVLLLGLVATVNLLVVLPTVLAQGGGPPMLLGIQGRLTDASGDRINGSKTVKFRLYTQDIGGTAVWTEQQTLTLVDGLFDAKIGSVVALDPYLFHYDELWLSTEVDNVESATRQRFLSSPFAVRAANGVPSGTVVPFAGATVPSGWLLCDGSEIAKATYPELGETLGTTWGDTSDNNIYFKLPDLRGRAVFGVGQGPGLTDRVLGQTYGEETHVLTVDEIPSHSHDYGDRHYIDTDPEVDAYATPNGDDVGHLQDDSRTTGSAGGGAPHENMPPAAFLQYIIKT